MFADLDAEERGGLLCSISLMTFQPRSAPWAAAKTGSVGPACWPSLGWSSYCGKSEPEEKFCCTVSSLLWMQPTAAKGKPPPPAVFLVCWLLHGRAQCEEIPPWPQHSFLTITICLWRPGKLHPGLQCHCGGHSYPEQGWKLSFFLSFFIIISYLVSMRFCNSKLHRLIIPSI